MAYIDKTTFNIYQKRVIKENSFECDDLIAPVIRHLNLKGYKTKSCCAGHIYLNEDRFYSTVPPEELSFDIEILNVKEVQNECTEGRLFSDLPSDTTIYQIDYLSEFLGAVIDFEKGKLPDNIPDGWEVDEEPNTELVSIRKYFDGDYNTVYDFFAEQVECMRKLKKWVDDLPQKEEKEGKE